MMMRTITLFILVLLVSLVPFRYAEAGTFKVVNSADQGSGSLNQAIDQANNSAGADTIEFAIPTTDANYNAVKKYWVIYILSPLPFLNDDSTFFDGNSQRLNIGVDNPNGLEVAINGAGLPPELPGIVVLSAGNHFHALSIGGFRGPTLEFRASAHHNIVTGCYLGTEANGLYGYNVKNSEGILLSGGAHDNIIGGIGENSNVISGFYEQAIKIENSAYNKVIGNYIGTSKTGLNAIGNGWWDYDLFDPSKPPTRGAFAIQITAGSKANQIGGTVAGEGNIICAGGRAGIRIESAGSDSNVVQGNYIGVAADGETVLANGESGLQIADGSAYNLIGGTEPGAANVISGNWSSGVQMRNGIHHNILCGNLIGTNASATTVLGNQHNAIFFFGDMYNGYPQNNEIGPGNTIIANGADEDDYERYGYTWAAVRLDSAGTAGNLIYGNFIGTNSDGTLQSSYNSGVIIGSGAHNNRVGPDNVIAKNKKYGVWVRQDSTSGNTITQNSIHDNGWGAIFLDAGGNNELAAPVITSANENGIEGLTIPRGIVEIFSDNASQAENYLATVLADTSGIFSWSGTTEQAFVTTTVTDTNGNTSALSNSVSLPVELSHFNALVMKNNIVRLLWSTASETNNFGFYIERKADDNPYTEIGFVKGNGTTQSTNYYSFDDKPPLSGKLTYQLRQVDFDGTSSSSKAVEVHLAPMQSFLLPAYPNPFNSSTVIKFNLQKAEHVKIRILNI
ncbi:MAG: hypothetical protein GXO75_03210, partial [Calditrichaeota bacterium]|nr:hypothetical protein [Calditrichota bacterium]